MGPNNANPIEQNSRNAVSPNPKYWLLRLREVWWFCIRDFEQDQLVRIECMLEQARNVRRNTCTLGAVHDFIYILQYSVEIVRNVNILKHSFYCLELITQIYDILMLRIFRQSGQLLTTLSLSELPTQLQPLKSTLVKSSIIGYDYATLISTDNTVIDTDNVDLSKLKYAVLSERPEPTISYQPVVFYVRKPDKKGIKISCSLYSTVQELAGIIEEKLQIPVLSQELFFNGDRLEEMTDTLKVLGLRLAAVVHVIDRRQIMVDLDTMFTVNLQGASLKSEVVPVEVKGKTTLGELRFRAAEKFGFPFESTIIAYCSQILDNTEKSLYTLSLVDGAFVKVLDERQAKVTHEKEQVDTTFEARKKKALAEEAEQIPQTVEVMRQADSVLLTTVGPDISILNSDIGADKSYAESFRINESYEETYNRAIHRQKNQSNTNNTPQKQQMPGKPFLKTVTESPPIIEAEAIQQPNQSAESKTHDEHNTSQALNIGVRRADSIKQFNIRIMDLSSNSYEVMVSEIDTVRDIRNKLESEHIELMETPQDFLLEGKLLEEDQIVKDLLPPGEEYTLFMMPKAQQ